MADDLPDGYTRRHVLAGAGGLTVGALTSTTATGGQPEQSRPSITDVDPNGLQGLVEQRLAEGGVRGAAVAVVVDGQVVLADGFGEAEPGRQATPTTPFRVASVSKPVVGTAVAELVARGDVALDRAVREYLPVDRVTWGQPVTLRNLMTHTGGFDLTNRDLWYPGPEQVGPLDEHLTPMPPQVRSPGELGAYSNHGVGLAGLTVATVLEEPFPAAMNELLFEPAGMRTASFAQPLPPGVADDHAVTGGLSSLAVDGPLAGIGPAPAGAMSVSARSMARFLELHCNDGRIDGDQRLHPEAIDLAQRRWFSHHEAIDGMTLGFVETHHGATRILAHDGASPLDGFTSQLRVVPDHDIGVFVAYNGTHLELDLADAVLEELLQAPTPPERTPTTPHRSAELPGTYQSLRRGVQAHDSLFTSLGADSVTVSVAEDGAIVVDGLGDPDRWIEVEPLVFEREGGTERLAFGENDTGALTQLFVGGTPSAFVQQAWHASPTLNAGGLLGGLLGLGWAYDRFEPTRHYTESRREYLGAARSDHDRATTVAARLGTGSFLAFILVVLGWTFLGTTTQFVVGFLTDPTGLLGTVYALPIVGGLATVAVVALVAAGLVTGRWSWRTRIEYTATAWLLLAVAWLSWHWNFFPL